MLISCRCLPKPLKRSRPANQNQSMSVRQVQAQTLRANENNQRVQAQRHCNRLFQTSATTKPHRNMPPLSPPMLVVTTFSATTKAPSNVPPVSQKRLVPRSTTELTSPAPVRQVQTQVIRAKENNQTRPVQGRLVRQGRRSLTNLSPCHQTKKKRTGEEVHDNECATPIYRFMMNTFD
jgi:hypothetical protein